MKYNHFFDQVYHLVARIPPGKVATYGQIAYLLGRHRAARLVGKAMSQTPEFLDIPVSTHRVVNRNGQMAPGSIFGGAARQRELLSAEGVVFRPDGCIDMAACKWQPPVDENGQVLDI